MSWDYPKDKNIKSLVDQNALYPITCLTTLDGKQKQKLLEEKCVLAKELFNNQNLLNILELNDEKKSEVLKEARELMTIKISE